MCVSYLGYSALVCIQDICSVYLTCGVYSLRVYVWSLCHLFCTTPLRRCQHPCTQKIVHVRQQGTHVWSMTYNFLLAQCEDVSSAARENVSASSIRKKRSPSVTSPLEETVPSSTFQIDTVSFFLYKALLFLSNISQ